MLSKSRVFFKNPIFLLIVFGLLLSFGATLGLILTVEFADNMTMLRDLELAYCYTGISTAIVFVIIAFVVGRQFEMIKNMSLHDALTRLPNRHFLMKQLAEIQEISEQEQKPYSILILDLDDFKQVNNRFGHVVGDKTLQAVAATIQETMRHSDFAVRYGGEEFVVVCPETDKEKAYSLAERLRQAIEQIPYKELGFEGQQTASIGVLEIPVEYHLKSTQVLFQVDKILYQAKHRGRNHVIMNELNYSLQQSQPARSGQPHRIRKNEKK